MVCKSFCISVKLPNFHERCIWIVTSPWLKLLRGNSLRVFKCRHRHLNITLSVFIYMTVFTSALLLLIIFSCVLLLRHSDNKIVSCVYIRSPYNFVNVLFREHWTKKRVVKADLYQRWPLCAKLETTIPYFKALTALRTAPRALRSSSTARLISLSARTTCF